MECCANKKSRNYRQPDLKNAGPKIWSGERSMAKAGRNHGEKSRNMQGLQRSLLFYGNFSLTCLPSSAPHECMRAIPLFHVRDCTSFIRSGWTLHHLILILTDDSFTHFWHKEGYGVMLHPPPIWHWVMPGPRGKMSQSEGNLRSEARAALYMV